MDAQLTHLVPTGVPGLDDVLFGGLPERGLYLLAGEPGTGKTTMGLQFLAEGSRAGERTLLITLSQDRVDLERIASVHGIALDAIDVEEIGMLGSDAAGHERQSVLRTTDVELSAMVERMREIMGRSEARRVVVDSLFELRLLSVDQLGYRRELLRLRDAIKRLRATALFVDYDDDVLGDRQLEGLAHGVLVLEKETPQFGADLRRMNVRKMRGHDFIGGYHDLTIRMGGLAVFPRVVPERSAATLTDEIIDSGIDGLDDMLGGGLQPGTTCLIVGQSGTGKSTLTTAYARNAARAGRRAAMFLFEERPETFRRRSADIGLDLSGVEAEGMLTLTHFNPVEVSPGEFSQAVVAAVEQRGAGMVVIDSLSGYLGALPDGRNLITQMHSLLSYLSRRNVLTVLTLTQHGLLGGGERLAVDASYLADSAVLLRHLEVGGDITRTITILKKRHGDHERAIRELVIGGSGISVRDPVGGAPPTAPVAG
jgi:circadian clock protein KaiC